MTRNHRSQRFTRRLALLLAAGLAIAGGSVPAATASSSQAGVAELRQATARFHDLGAALDAGYGAFYVCTEQPGVGAMGQHFVNPVLVGDPAIDPLRPEVLVYAPKPGGGYRLVAVEYVTFEAAWSAAFGPALPTVFGQPFHLVGTPNRYGLPAFFERHVWVWEPNPAGLFEDWNPNVSCRGQGDGGG
jgi:hypothetical protein